MTNKNYPTKHWFHQSNNQTLAHLEPQNQVMLLLQSRESGKMQAGVWSCGPWEQEALTQSFTLFCIPYPNQRERQRQRERERERCQLLHQYIPFTGLFKDALQTLHLLKYIQTTCARVCAAFKVIVIDCAQNALSVDSDTHCTVHIAKPLCEALPSAESLSPELKSVTIQVLTHRSIHTKSVDVCDALSYQISDS